MRVPILALALAPLLVLCARCGSYSGSDPDIGETQANCASDDPRVGTEAELDERAHGVAGRAVIVDDCTIELRDFHFDGGGLDVRAIGARDADFKSGTVLTNDLRNTGGYDGDTVRIPFPISVTLADVQQISIWCVPAASNFGAAAFRF